MFDEARQDLADALADEQTALSVSTLKDRASVGGLVVDQAIKQHATVAERDDTRYVTQVDDGPTYDLPSAESADADATTDGGAVAAADGADAQAGPDPSAETRTTERAAHAGSEGALTTHVVGGLRVDANPARLLAGEPTGDDVYGAPRLTNDHPGVPNTQVPYFPVDLGERDTEEVFYRLLAQHKPIILEGEAGTGKNQLVKAAGAALNDPTYRQEFGADTSVYDVVGEKDLDGDGGTYYVLGKAAKAAMFGGIYVADEINMATGSVTSYLHPLFEERGSRELELRGTGRTLHDLPPGEEWDPEKHLGKYIHPHFYAVGTCNPLHYADTNEMNDALRSRCTVVEHPYLADSEADIDGIETEAELLAAETDCDADDDRIQNLVRVAAVLREARREGNALSCPIGHRELRDTVDLAGPDEEFMSFEAAADIKMRGQAALKQDKQYIADTIEEEL